MNTQLQSIADHYGTPCYVYSADAIAARAQALRETFGGRFRLRYAAKANPNPAILNLIEEQIDTIDISSSGELRIALSAGWPAARLSFTGPGKRAAELEAALTAGVGEIVVESLYEARTLDAMAATHGIRQAILLRLSPARLPRGFGVNMAGKPSQFGVDEEDMPAALSELAKLRHLDLQGLHIYSGTQCLDVGALAENWRIFIEIFRRAAALMQEAPRQLVFGAGLGIPYYENQQPLDLRALAEDITPDLDALRAEPPFTATRLALELGRYLVGEAGVYVTRVLHVKHSRGTHIAICDGGMNHHMAACGHLGSVLHRNYRLFRIGHGSDEAQTYDLVGPLCTTLDTLGHRVTLPTLAPGDLIGVPASGAYGLSSSPIHFISHDLPRELLVDGSQVRDVSFLSHHAAPRAAS